MSRWSIPSSCLFVALFACGLISMLADDVAAQRWRRSRARSSTQYRNNQTTQSHSSSGSKTVAPRNDPHAVGLRTLQINYDYDAAKRLQEMRPDRVRVYFTVNETTLREHRDDLIAEVRMTDLSESQNPRVAYCPVTIADDDATGMVRGSFEVSNDGTDEPFVKPSKVYRYFVSLHHKSEEREATAAIGRIPEPYYVATSGATPLDQARQQITMRTFKEFYCRKRGIRSNERYPMDCYAYYMWATGFCTVGSNNGRTNLSRLFGGATPYQRGQDIPAIAGGSPIHGDYVRKPGHSFMLLSFDAQQNRVWTMEGNFNNTIEVVIRSISSSWTVGHLRESHIRSEVFTGNRLTRKAPSSVQR